MWWRREARIDNEEGLDLCDKASIATNRASKETRGARENSCELCASKEAEKEEGRKWGGGERDGRVRRRWEAFPPPMADEGEFSSEMGFIREKFFFFSRYLTEILEMIFKHKNEYPLK